MLSILCGRLTIKVKVGMPEGFKVGWYPHKKTGSIHLNLPKTTDSTAHSTVWNLNTGAFTQLDCPER